MVRLASVSHNSSVHTISYLNANPSEPHVQTPDFPLDMEQQWRNAEEVYFRAVKLYMNKNLDEAETEFKRSLQICPDFYNAQRYLNLMPIARQLYSLSYPAPH